MLFWGSRKAAFFTLISISFSLVFISLHPFFQPFLKQINHAFFWTINDTLKEPSAWRLFWAFSNHRIYDYIGDVVVAICIVGHLRNTPQELFSKRLAEAIFCLLFMGSITLFFNCLLLRHTIQIPSLSPSLVFENCVRLSKEITLFSVKDCSKTSFPSDHAITALSFAMSFCVFAKKRWALLGFFYAIMTFSPRLVVGAHWLTDLLVGSLPVCLVYFACVFCTPLHEKILFRLQYLLDSMLEKLRARRQALD